MQSRHQMKIYWPSGDGRQTRLKRLRSLGHHRPFTRPSTAHCTALTTDPVSPPPAPLLTPPLIANAANRFCCYKKQSALIAYNLALRLTTLALRRLLPINFIGCGGGGGGGSSNVF